MPDDMHREPEQQTSGDEPPGKIRAINLGAAVAIGGGIGVALGTAMSDTLNLGLWIAIGAAVGILVPSVAGMISAKSGKK